MNSLPPELLARIAAFLPSSDLRSLRLVSKQHAAIALRPLFEVLRFSGRRQGQPPPWNFGPAAEPELLSGQPGRMRTVEFAKVPEAVDEVLESSLARYAKMFTFDPAYYRQGFWRDYRMQLEVEMHEPVYDLVLDEVDEEDDDDDAPGEDRYEAAVERVLEHRRTRPEREADVIAAAEATWDEKMAEQKQNEAAVVAALSRLFQAMTALERIEVKPWMFNGADLFPGLEDCISYGIDSHRRGTFPSTFLLEVLARALYDAGRRIRHLHVFEFFYDHFHDTPSTRHLFTGLRHINLNMSHVEFLHSENRKPNLLLELFKCAQPTLERLSIMGGGQWPQLPSRGEHSLLKMLGEGVDETPLVFPRLEFVRLGGLILSTPPLLRFLRAQPNLKRLEFSHIYLSTANAGWPSLAEALPMSVESWKVCGPLGHEPVDGDGPTAYNWMTTWVPQQLPPSSGWRAIPRTYGTIFLRTNQHDGNTAP